MKFIFILLYVIISKSGVGQTNHSLLYKSDDLLKYKYALIVRSPSNCVNLILIDSNFKGKMIFGSINNSFSDAEYKRLDTVYEQKSFFIKNRNVRKKLETAVLAYPSKYVFKTNIGQDALRYELFKGSRKIFDYSGNYDKKLESVLKIYSNFLPYRIGTYCIIDK